jgi:hypothetical protein
LIGFKVPPEFERWMFSKKEEEFRLFSGSRFQV